MKSELIYVCSLKSNKKTDIKIKKKHIESTKYYKSIYSFNFVFVLPNYLMPANYLLERVANTMCVQNKTEI